MPKFGATSTANLATCHPVWKKILNKVIEMYDCSVLEGYRNEERQNYLYSIELSEVQYPNSYHNKTDEKGKPESWAVDVAPYPNLWKSKIIQWYIFAGIIKGVAFSMGYVVTWGRDWDSDYIFNDQTFNDFAHFQLEL